MVQLKHSAHLSLQPVGLAESCQNGAPPPANSVLEVHLQTVQECKRHCWGKPSQETIVGRRTARLRSLHSRVAPAVAVSLSLCLYSLAHARTHSLARQTTLGFKHGDKDLDTLTPGVQHPQDAVPKRRSPQLTNRSPGHLVEGIISDSQAPGDTAGSPCKDEGTDVTSPGDDDEDDDGAGAVVLVPKTAVLLLLNQVSFSTCCATMR